MARPAPFLYFTSHTDPVLAHAVRDGRRREFAHCAGAGEIPDPQEPQTFARSRLNHRLREQGQHSTLLRFYRDLIALRKRSPALHTCDKECLEVTVHPDSPILLVRRWQSEADEVLLVASFAAAATSARIAIPTGHWLKVLDAAANMYGGSAGVLGLPPVLEGNVLQLMTCPPFTFAIYWRDPEAA